MTWAELPPEAPRGRFGKRVQAVACSLTGRYRDSQREAREPRRDLFKVEISLGEISAIEKGMSGALEKPVEEAREYVRRQKAGGADETGFREGNERMWLWGMTAGRVCAFWILKNRFKEAARKVLGSFGGILTTDRLAVYGVHLLKNRQMCWAHLIRDFEGFLTKRGGAPRIGKELLAEADPMFELWNRVREGTLNRSSFLVYVSGIRGRVKELLHEGTRCRSPGVSGKCRMILEVFPALWTFARVEGVEPTHNACERALRPAVLWRKGSLGTQSEAGSRYVERMMTVALTLRQQGRNLLDYLVEAAQARCEGRPAPSLLPSAATLAAARQAA